MRVVLFQLAPCELAMAAPVKLTRHTFQTKKSWYLTAKTDRGEWARAEIPCLPGVHPVPYREIPSLIRPTLDTIKDVSLPPEPQWDKPLFGLLPCPPLPIPFLFALEGLFMAFYRTSFLRHFSLPSDLSVPLNELFIPGNFEVSAPVAPVLKVKLPGLSSPASTLAGLLSRKPDCRLRLDPNRTLTPTALESLLDSLPPGSLEYVEDPYPDLWRGLEQFNRFPLALDKELAPALKSARFPDNTVALVVKPGRDLAISGTLRLILEKKYTIVVSSAYETPTGLWCLIHLAAAARTPCGLDVQKLFRPSPSLRFHPVEGGTIRLVPDYFKGIDV